MPIQHAIWTVADKPVPLNERNIAINVVFFQVFDHGVQQLLSRAARSKKW